MTSSANEIAAMLAYREFRPETYLRQDTGLRSQAFVLRLECDRVMRVNKAKVSPIPGTSQFTSTEFKNIQGVGHTVNCHPEEGDEESHSCDIQDKGGDVNSALVAFLLALDDDPGD